MAGIYIHIPFCHNKCSYCDFYSTPNHRLKSEYIKALTKEIRLWLSKPEIHNIDWTTIYIGGGTPSLLEADELSDIISELPLTNVQEFTIEANPENISERWVSSILPLGINRVSIGIQSLADNELKIVGRNHSSIQAIKALQILRLAGVNNISDDLIYGLPGQTLDSWERSLNTIMDFRPEHLSAYSLSYEPGTRLYAQRETGKIFETEDDIICQMFEMLTEKTLDHGYEHYEISNFGLPGRHSMHNSSYWTFSPYLGIGAAAHGYIDGIRFANPWNIRKYIDSITHGQIIADKEILTANDIYNEYVMTALRTTSGIVYDRLMQLTGDAMAERLKSSASKLINSGLLENTIHGVRIPQNKWLVSDAIIRDLMV